MLMIIFSFLQNYLYSDESLVPVPLATYALSPISVKTADDAPHVVNLKISLAYKFNLELNNELIRKRSDMELIIKIFLEGKGYEDLDSVSDAVEISEEIKKILNSRLENGEILEVYFREFIVK